MHTMAQPGATSVRPKYEVLIVPAERAQEYRADFARLIEGKQVRVPVLYTIDQAIELVEQGRFQLWLFRVIGEEFPCLAMITEIAEYPAGRTINICLVVGTKMRPMMKQFHTLFFTWCRRHNADYIEAIAHPSIAKVLSKYGFAPTGVRMHLPLNIQ